MEDSIGRDQVVRWVDDQRMCSSSVVSHRIVGRWMMDRSHVPEYRTHPTMRWSGGIDPSSRKKKKKKRPSRPRPHLPTWPRRVSGGPTGLRRFGRPIGGCGLPSSGPRMSQRDRKDRVEMSGSACRPRSRPDGSIRWSNGEESRSGRIRIMTETPSQTRYAGRPVSVTPGMYE